MRITDLGNDSLSDRTAIMHVGKNAYGIIMTCKSLHALHNQFENVNKWHVFQTLTRLLKKVFNIETAAGF